jgi:transcription factor SPN1
MSEEEKVLNEVDQVEELEAGQSETPAKSDSPAPLNDIMDSDDEELSDLDEEQFQDEILPIDEEVYKIGRHKRSGGSGAAKSVPKEKQRERTGKRKTTEDGTILSDSEDDRRVPDEIPDEELDPETRKRRELERRLDAALKPVKRKKLDGDDLEQMQDERISRLRDEMRDAAAADAECIRNGTPAVHKLELLPEVRDVLQKHNLADSILDNNLLESVRLWLEPLPDASLPAYEIQKELFAAIEKLPIKTMHLRESGLGKVVLFYQKSKRPQLAIKRTADKLIGDWTRPIMGRSDNYRDKHVATKAYLPEDVYTAGSGNAGTKQDEDSLAAAAAARRKRAHIPSANSRSFEVAPRSDLSAAVGQRRETNDQFKRIRQKIQGVRSVKSRKSGVSIEGKGLAG